MNTIEQPINSAGQPLWAGLAPDQVLPLTAAQYAANLIKQRWGDEALDAVLVDLNYDFSGYPAQGSVHQGRVRLSQSLVQALLNNYQTVGAGRFGETAFGLYTPPTVGPQVHIVEIDASINPDGSYDDYEGIYRVTEPQVYGPDTQLALQPAAFKQWVWTLAFKAQYAAYVANAWPDDRTLLAAAPYPLRTSVKLAFIMAAWLQYQERSLSREGLGLALRVAGLDPGQTWGQLTLAQLQAQTPMPSSVEAGRLSIYRYSASDIGCFRDKNSGRRLLYIPGNASPFHEFADHRTLCQWVIEIGRDAKRKTAFVAHFAEDDQQDGTFHAGVRTALAGMVTWPRQYRLKKGHGFFNNDGFWPPEDYIGVDVRPTTEDPFAQWVKVMKAAAQASVDTIRDDAQVNRDNLSAVVEPVVQWIERFAPLALFVPGGEGLLALAGLIDAGYGLDEAVHGTTTDERWAGVGRTVFGLLNALPVIKAGAVLKDEERLLTVEHVANPVEAHVSAVPARLRAFIPEASAFSNEVLQQIGRVCGLDPDALGLLQAGQPPSPILVDTLNRFRIDQDLQQALERLPGGSVEAEQARNARVGQFSERYAALQQSADEWVRLFQSQYPGLPKCAIEQMLERAGIDIRAPHTLAEAKRVLGELSGKARQYEFHVRVARAYEGLYLASVENPDSDVLALHSLERLAGWPIGIRLEVCEASAVGRVLDSIGPQGAPYSRQLIRQGTRYQGLAAGQSVDFHQALLNALSQEQRAALGLRADQALQDLRTRIRAELRPRAELELGLQRMDSGLTFDSHGLRGGGFPSTAQGEAFSRTITKLQIREIYPSQSDEELGTLLDQWGEHAQTQLARLNQQLLQLRVDLAAWIGQVDVDVENMDVDLLDPEEPEAEGMDEEQIDAENDARIADAIQFERRSRLELATELEGLWRGQGEAASRVYHNGEFVGFRLEMDFEHFHSLPALNVTLPEVVELSMTSFSLTESASLSPFLRAFPRLRVLDLSGTDLHQPGPGMQWVGHWPEAIGELTELTHLDLSQTGLVLTEATAGALSGLSRLVALDMRVNPLGRPPVVVHLTALRRLNLRATGIRVCPVGVLDRPYLELLDLRENQIARIPPAVRQQSVAGSRLLLAGNPITDEDSLRWIVQHRQQTGINVWMAAPNADFAQPDAWLTGFSAEQQARAIQHWQHLATLPGSERLFGTLDMIRRSADFRVNYPSLQQRIWHLLDALDTSPPLRQHVLQDVQWTATDGDNPFASFEHLEARVAAFNTPVPER